MSHQQPPKPSSRKTVGFFAASPRMKQPALYAYMFLEDVHNGILQPNLGINGEKPKKIEIVGGAEEVAIARSICASVARGTSYSTRNTAQSAIESIALHLAWYGEVLFEVVDMGERRQMLEMVPDSHLFRPPLAILQFVPKSERSRSKGQRWIVLPRSRVWNVCMPATLGGPRMYRKLLKQLEEVSTSIPEFWLQDLQARQLNSEFEINEYKRSQHIAVAKLTRRWGWDARGIAQEFQTEFFRFHRGMQFRRAQALLRQHIVHEINQLFVRLHIRAELRLEGYPNALEVDRLIKSAISGELSYVEAYGQSA